MLNYALPVIERMATGGVMLDKRTTDEIEERRYRGQVISDYLHGKGERKAYFSAVARLLGSSEYRRMLLYLPLADLQEAPAWFRNTYMDAWYSLLGVLDARENFFEGDTLEADARPNGELERVVKCAHLAPWLLKAGYLRYDELKGILTLNQGNTILLRSFANTWRLVDDFKVLAEDQLWELRKITARISQREKIDPLYISKARKKWLEERRTSRMEELLTPNAKLAGPFSPNMTAFMSELRSIQTKLEPDEIVLVGGSRLKGYGLRDSDFDVFKLRDLEKRTTMAAGSPNTAHIYFNALWLGGEEVDNLAGVALKYAMKYFGKADRHLSIERLENDLLQYRLLHKGFRRFYGEYATITGEYTEMDGNCAFYDERYRKIATELYAKYVFIPA